MKKSILLLLLTFVYSTVFAGYWYQSITIINNTDETYNLKEASVNTGEWRYHPPSNVLLPHTTEQIDAIAPYANEGDEIHLLYTGKDDPTSFLRIEMVDDVGPASISFNIYGDDYFNYTEDVYDDDQAWYQARVYINNP